LIARQIATVVASAMATATLFFHAVIVQLIADRRTFQSLNHQTSTIPPNILGEMETQLRVIVLLAVVGKKSKCCIILAYMI